MNTTEALNLENIKLTQYSHGAGCGCKIAPKVLDRMLGQVGQGPGFPNLLVGNDKRDDAAVFDQGDGTAIVSTTDFFMPIVDDPVDFGRIAATNAISDIYAMGAAPMMAIAILGWPINKLPAEVAGAVIEGGRLACQAAGIPLAGGHSIDSPEPIFGLAVTGKVDISNIKKNSGAKVGAKLYLTKGLGVGILATAQKKALLLPAHEDIAKTSMCTLNNIGLVFGQQSYVQAMTDVTGFGLFGHLVELCKGSAVSAKIIRDQIPLLDKKVIHGYIEQGAIPGGTKRNWDSYGMHVGKVDELTKTIGCDPQTSGGLLVAIDPAYESEFLRLTAANSLELTSIGYLTERSAHLIEVDKA